MLKNKSTCGSLFMVVAPSGVGKSTLINALLKQETTIQLSVSYTTRLPRLGEKNGREYYFITTKDFLKRKNNGEFFEWAKVHNNYYGTSCSTIIKQINNGIDVFLEIDWQGAQQIKKKLKQLVFLFYHHQLLH